REALEAEPLLEPALELPARERAVLAAPRAARRGARGQAARARVARVDVALQPEVERPVERARAPGRGRGGRALGPRGQRVGAGEQRRPERVGLVARRGG